MDIREEWVWELVEVGRKMRAKQNHFFRTKKEDRRPQMKADAQALERQFDDILAKFPGGEDEPMLPGFGGGGS